jgi:hypothetical protein
VRRCESGGVREPVAEWRGDLNGAGMTAESRAWFLGYFAATLLILAILIIRVMRWLYNHRLISYRATDHFFRASKILRQRADRLITRKN